MTEFASQHFLEGDRLLRRDMRLLGWLLRRVAIEQGDAETWCAVRSLRNHARRRRQGCADAEQKLIDEVRTLNLQQSGDVVKALGVFFDLANLAEDRHRIRVLRRRRVSGSLHETITDARRQLQSHGLSSKAIAEAGARVEVEFVLTAHPTEAKRRTVRRILRRLRSDLRRLDRQQDNHELNRARKRAILKRMRLDLVALWCTDPLRPHRPTVLEELDRSLYAIRRLWRVAPRIGREWRRRFLQPATPTDQANATPTPPPIRLGGWIGGDGDGNPNVTAHVTRTTIERLSDTALRWHRKTARDLAERLSHVGATGAATLRLREILAERIRQWPRLARRIERSHPRELFRRWLLMIDARLAATTAAKQTTQACLPYPDPASLDADLQQLHRALCEARLADIADRHIQPWRDALAVFGFHLSRLDIRHNSMRLNRTVGQCLAAMRITAEWLSLPEAKRREILTQPQFEHRAMLDAPNALDDDARQLLELFSLLHKIMSTRPEALGVFIVSMTHEVSDVLAVQWLQQLAAARAGAMDCPPALMPVAPLFETIEDLHGAGRLLDQLLSLQPYRQLLQGQQNRQVCMVGYSDSAKEGGYVSASWALHEGQIALADAADKHGVELVLFHGRGGALGRGGGPAARAILAQPPTSMRGRLRMTEQGEMIAERFDTPAIAHRHLEQVLWAAALVTAEPTQPIVTTEQFEAMQEFARQAHEAYRALVTQPAFVDYLTLCTPIDWIEQLPIGSRPSRRSGQRTLEDLRAIPFTFAWTQSRQLINAFFGLGSAWSRLDGDGRRTIQSLYRNWRFFTTLIDNAEIALAKCDAGLVQRYAALGLGDEDEHDGLGIAPVRDLIVSEIEQTRQAVLQITGQQQLLDATAWLQRSVMVRNPYVDALNALQIELMRRRRNLKDSAASGNSTGAENAHGSAEMLDHALRMTIQAIAAGLRNTG